MVPYIAFPSSPTVYFEMFYGVATSTPVVHFLSQENNLAKVYYSAVILFVTLAL